MSIGYEFSHNMVSSLDTNAKVWKKTVSATYLKSFKWKFFGELVVYKTVEDAKAYF